MNEVDTELSSVELTPLPEEDQHHHQQQQQLITAPLQSSRPSTPSSTSSSSKHSPTTPRFSQQPTPTSPSPPKLTTELSRGYLSTKPRSDSQRKLSAFTLVDDVEQPPNQIDTEQNQKLQDFAKRSHMNLTNSVDKWGGTVDLDLYDAYKDLQKTDLVESDNEIV